MTKRREPLTYQHTLTKVAAQIGWDRCGAVCGVSGKSVRNWSDPDCETEIRMIDAERLDRAFIEHGGDHAPFLRLMTLRLDMAERERAQADMVRAAASVAKESGEAVAAILDAASSGCADKMRRARREGEEAIASLTGALASLGTAEV